jgi:hypothetical protein
MAIPVLKNRILLLTGGQFRESEFGASSFREFLGGLPSGLLARDESQPPGFVILSSGDAATASAQGPRYARVRSDLWRAALDYSSGQRYVWDASLKQARLAKTDEPGPYMPTISATEFKAVRLAFADNLKARVSGDPGDRLAVWAAEGLPTAFLPPRLRPLWNVELKRQVEARLQPWFAANQVEPPSSFTYEWQVSPEKGTTDQLRHFILSCIKAMSEQELAELRIPPRVALRVRLDDRDNME